MENTDQYKFTSYHEWLINHGDGTATAGITDHAQEQLGDVVFVELPEVDRDFKADDEFFLVNPSRPLPTFISRSAVVYLPSMKHWTMPRKTSTIPPLTEGWIARFQLDNPEELGPLLSAEQYQASLAETA